MATAMVNGISRPVSPGTLLSQLLAPDAQLETPCGGRGRCGKCRVIARGELSEPSEEEKRCLSEEELARGLRLACCTRALGDCEISTTARFRRELCSASCWPLTPSWRPPAAAGAAAANAG